MGGPPAARVSGGRLPLLLGGAAAVAAALLFVTGTAPAIREGEELRAIERDRLELLRALVRESRELGQLGHALRDDPQAVLVELDRLGLLPPELEQEAPAEQLARRAGEVAPRVQ